MKAWAKWLTIARLHLNKTAWTKWMTISRLHLHYTLAQVGLSKMADNLADYIYTKPLNMLVFYTKNCLCNIHIITWKDKTERVCQVISFFFLWMHMPNKTNTIMKQQSEIGNLPKFSMIVFQLSLLRSTFYFFSQFLSFSVVFSKFCEAMSNIHRWNMTISFKHEYRRHILT